MRSSKQLSRLGKYMLLVSVLLFAGLSTVYASGVLEPPQKNHYFYGTGENYVLQSGYYAVATMRYDGEIIMNRQKLTGRGGFGGYTTEKRKQNALIDVELKIYTNNNNLIASKSWSGNLSGSWQGFSWQYTPQGASHWVFDGGFQFKTDGETSNGSIKVKVGF